VEEVATRRKVERFSANNFRKRLLKARRESVGLFILLRNLSSTCQCYFVTYLGDLRRIRASVPDSPDHFGVS
jgi:hypothetical protein